MCNHPRLYFISSQGKINHMPRARLLTKCGKEHLCGSLEKLDWEKYILLNLHWFTHLSSRLTSLFRNSQKNIFFLKKLSSTLLLNYKSWVNSNSMYRKSYENTNYDTSALPGPLRSIHGGSSKIKQWKYTFVTLLYFTK